MRTALLGVALFVSPSSCHSSVSPATATATATTTLAAAAPTTAAVIDLPGATNGITWEPTDHAVYLVDDAANQVMRRTVSAGLQPVAAFPRAAKTELGGLVRVGCTFVATSFGSGTTGTVVTVAPGGAATVLARRGKVVPQ